MSETPFTHSSDDELLSAYVDGELTEDEHAKVEQRLRDDPNAKALVDQLREISQTMQSLPRLTASEGLRQAVLQRTLPSESEERQLSWSRRLLWPALAVAAVLMLMLYRPQDNIPDDILDKGLLADATQQEQQKSNQEIRKVPEFRAFDASGLSHSGPKKASSLRKSENANILKAEVGADDSGISGTIQNELLKSSSAPRQSLGDTAFSGDKDGMPAIPSASAAEVHQVHLTLNRSQWGNEQFDRLLRSHNIVVRDSRPQSESSDAGFDSEALDLRQSKISARRKMPATEQVLIEASAEQMEAVLADFHADVANCFALQIDTPDGRWKRLQRNSLSANVSSSPSAVEGITSGPKLAAEAFNRSGAKGEVPRGWAVRSYAQPAIEKSGTGVFRFRDEVAVRNALSKQLDTIKQSSPSPNDSPVVRMMFIIHWQNAPSGGSSEPTESAGKKRE